MIKNLTWAKRGQAQEQQSLTLTCSMFPGLIQAGNGLQPSSFTKLCNLSAPLIGLVHVSFYLLASTRER